MRAWLSGEQTGVDALELVECPVPEPATNEFLVRVSHAALNFSDLLMIDDKYQVRPPRPFIPGQEIAGIVEKAPAGSAFSPGDTIASKVFWGGFAEFVCVRSDMAISVPEGANLASAIALPVSYVTAIVALDHCAKVSRKDTVLVHAAAGGAGLAAVEIATARGATVIATASSAEKLAIARSHGARHAINYSEGDWFRQVKELTGGRGVDIVFDPVGGSVGEDSLRCLAMDGTLLIVGFAGGRITQLPANRLLLKRASARGVYWNHDTDGEMLRQVNQELAEMFATGTINPVVQTGYGFEELPKALADLASRKIAGKIALRVSEDSTQ